MALTKDQIQRLNFDEEVLDVIIGGQSAIDGVKAFSVRTSEEALGFLDCYGFSLDNPIEKAELLGHFQEAVNFIRQYFLHPSNPEGLKADMPRKLMELTDPTQLLIWSSTQNTGKGSLGHWACSILRVMHTISHIDRDVRTPYFPDIQMQIMDRFYRHVHNEGGKLYLGKDRNDPECIDLVAFETKPKKSRESILLKLLHKPENVAEELFDRVGVRFVTKTKLESLRVIKYLKDRNIIMPANIKPSRSRNTLVDVESFRSALDEVKKNLDSIGYEAAVQTLSNASEGVATSGVSDNPHSNKDYAAIQFTCRQLVKIKNHLYDDLKRLKSLDGSVMSEEIRQILGRLDLKNLQKEIRFFYPFEIQVCDEKSHHENMKGQSAHSAYKKSQIQAALRRVMKGFY